MGKGNRKCGGDLRVTIIKIVENIDEE